MFIQPCFIRKNTPKLRKKLLEIGHTLCPCTEFEDADWLLVSNDNDLYSSVHGLGYADETIINISKEDIFNNFLSNTNHIDCGTNEELFFALAALRDDTNDNQWFIAQDTMWDENYNGEITVYFEEGEWLIWDYYSLMEDMPSRFRKATVEEIIEHFKK